MALNTSTQVLNSNPGSVTVVVAETTGTGGNDAILDVYITIDPTEAVFTGGHTPAGYRPAAPTSVICWKTVTVTAGTTALFTAAVDKAATLTDPVAALAHCTVTGTYGGNFYYEERDAIISFL